jgi:hypothetical protein
VHKRGNETLALVIVGNILVLVRTFGSTMTMLRIRDDWFYGHIASGIAGVVEVAYFVG